MRLGVSVAAALALAVLVAGGAGARAGHRAEARIEVEVVLDDQVDVAAVARQYGDRRGRIEAVVRALHARAEARQKGLLQLLYRRKGEGSVGRIVPLWIFDGLVVEATPAVIKELAARPEVEEIRPSATIQAPTAAAAGSPVEPNIALVNAPALWDLGLHGEGVVVASMDTGVDVTHPDLAGAWRGGSDSWYDPNGQHQATPTDISGHGTWTMGVMVGGSAGGTAVGMAPAAKWIAVKLFNDAGTATTAVAHQGFQWLLDPDGDAATPDAPNVVLGSWTLGSGTSCNLEFAPDIAALRAAGILPVFAAGNSGPNAPSSMSPANNPGAFAVGSTTLGDVVDGASSRGPSACDGRMYPDAVAPGVDVWTTDLYAGYANESGTSLAAPHVAGALALLLTAFPHLTADEQAAALQSGAVDLGPAGPDNAYGAGRLDVLRAYDTLATSPDFALAASPSSSTSTFTVTATARNGFAGDVALSLSGLQGTASFEPATIAGASGSSTLTVTPAAELAPGSYPLTITGTSGPLSRAVAVTLVVPAPPDFTVAAAPASATTLPGGSTTYTVTVGAQDGFAGTVSLGLSGLQGTSTFSPATVAGSGTSTLTVTASAGLAPGSYALTVTGSSGALSHSATVTLVVSPPPDFTLAASPASATALPGGSAAYTVTVGAQNGFTGSVALSLSGVTPAQAAWSFAPSSIVRAGSSTLTVTAAASLAPGSYPLTVTGTSGARSHSATVTLVVSAPPDFTVSASPASVTVTAGSNASYAVTVGSVGAFSGTVGLSATGLPSGASSSFAPSSVAAPGTSALTIRTTRTTTRGTFTVTVTGKSGTLTRRTTVSLVVR